MSQPPAMSVATRRALVGQLIAADPNLSNRSIAGQLGVSKDTIRLDIAAIRQGDPGPSPASVVSEPEASPERPELTLILDEPMRQALAVMRALRGEPDTPAANTKIVRAAIRAMADTINEHTRQDGR
ncbi:hypothetical protein [Streptomyces sp. NPDC059759]|uniref:hypothetical protein n=1 Tax=Streptomyces sp. NPDC059759 TaxID=3346936 RepID=UPI00364C6E8D